MKEYNTSINILGSISDVNVIIETIKHFNKTNSLEDTKEEFVEGNAFGFDISSSRKRFFSLIKKLYLKDPEDPSNDFFIKSISNNASDSLFKRQLIYLETFRKNDLFHDLIVDFIYKKYHENRRLITTSETLDFLNDYGTDTKLEDLSESTLKIISSKFIGFMKRINFFEKETRIKSMIAYPYPDEKIISYIVYLLKAADLSDNEVYESDLFKALMLNDSEKLELLKQGAMAGYYDFDFSGAGNATFTLNYDQEEIIDELFR